MYTAIVTAALRLNPAFNIYRIFDMVCVAFHANHPAALMRFRSSPPFCGTFSGSRQSLQKDGGLCADPCNPPPYSGTFPQIQVQPVYFNDPKVKAAIHAPVDVEWTECGAVQSVFVAPGDTSLPASYDVLPRVIARGTRTVVVSGLADFVLISEGWGTPLSPTPAFSP